MGESTVEAASVLEAAAAVSGCESDKNTPAGGCASNGSSGSSKESRKSGPRPALQIYRPPGLRAEPSSTNSKTKPSEAAGVKQPQTANNTTNIDNNNSIHDTANSPPPPLSSLSSPDNTRNNSASSPVKVDTRPSANGEGRTHKEMKRNGQIPEHQERTLASPTTPALRLRASSTLSDESAASRKSLDSLSLSTGTDQSSERSAPVAPPARGNANNRLSQVSIASSGKGTTGAAAASKKPSLAAQSSLSSRALTPQEALHAGVSLRALGITSTAAAADLERLIASEFSCELSGAEVGEAMARFAVESGATTGRAVAKAAQLLKDSSCFIGLRRGLITGISTYFETRAALRQERLRSWLALLSLITDLYVHIGDASNGELISIIFDSFGYLLRPPVLDTVKIEELEMLISALLSLGYELERECPDRLSAFKDLIRDAFMMASEPWARKMILLMLELSACSWKLPPEANEYYFQNLSN